MKDIKCPLCDSKLVKRCACDYESIVALTCLNCGYQILDEVDLNLIRNNEYNHALSISDHEAAERFISKFPPIMRVKVGDKVEVLETGNKSLISEVRQVRVKQGVIAVIGSRRLYNTIDVFRWPWELERKGGAEQ